MNPSDENGTPPEDRTPPDDDRLTEAEPLSPPPESPRRRGRRLTNLLVLLLLVIALAEAVYIVQNRSMRSNQPTPSASAGPQGERKVLYWVDPMNPQRKYDKPGKASDGMDLVPVYAEGTGPQAAPPPEGAVKISPERQQLVGVRYGKVSEVPLTKTIRAVATLTYDETKIAKIHPKVEGWIDRVYVNFTGELVRKNQALLTIYSPELVATQEEYLLALRARDSLGSSSFQDVATGANSLLEAARTRLELWDISEKQIAELEKTKKPVKNLTLYSPGAGFVTTRNSYENQRVTPDTELYAIADLSTIWAIADFYEYEVGNIRLGQQVNLTLAAFPGRIFRGRVTYIYPQLETTTRTLRVRAELPNPNFSLKPDMYGNVELEINFGRRLAVPEEAVLDSGTEQVVFVALHNGYFEPRQVRIGDRVDDQVIVLSGLKAGETIVTSGNFLIDAESRLKSATSGMGMPGMPGMSGMGQGEKPGTQTAKPPKQAAPATPPAKERPMSPSMKMKPE